MIHKLKLYLFTLTYLKKEQVFYRLFYFAKNRVSKTAIKTPIEIGKVEQQKLVFQQGIFSAKSYSAPLTFTYLNKTKTFIEDIDWNAEGETKLWKYNLNYFDFLLQKDLPSETGQKLLYHFIRNTENIKVGLDAYPTSIRLINWVKFLAVNRIIDPLVTRLIDIQANHLRRNLELHVLGNHLLENGFGLLFASFHLKSSDIFKTAQSLINRELKEEILSDGGHFERSVMYHQLILFRILDSLNLILNNNWEVVPSSFVQNLKEKAQLMLAWLNNVTFTNNSIPLFNDSAIGIAPSKQELISYAKKLNLHWNHIPLSSSGYRLLKKKAYEICVDVGEIGAAYVPGHAHSDTFSFVMNVKQLPFIVDTGASTYENSPRRFYERSTEAHNTVKVGPYEQSEIWSSFRVARRAHITKILEKGNSIKATHNGYKRLGRVLHSREFIFEEEALIIIDSIQNNSRNLPNSAFLHIHGDIRLTYSKNEVQFLHSTYKGKITFNGAEAIKISPQKASLEFNQFYPINRIEIPFKDSLTTTIKIQ